MAFIELTVTDCGTSLVNLDHVLAFDPKFDYDAGCIVTFDYIDPNDEYQGLATAPVDEAWDVIRDTIRSMVRG